MTTDDLKRERDGHLGYGLKSDRPQLRPLFEFIAWRRNREGSIVGFFRSDGGPGAFEYGLGPKLREKLIEAEYQGA